MVPPDAWFAGRHTPLSSPLGSVFYFLSILHDFILSHVETKSSALQTLVACLNAISASGHDSRCWSSRKHQSSLELVASRRPQALAVALNQPMPP